MNNSNLSRFDFKGQEVRFVEGLPVANDVAKALGYADPKSTVRNKVKSKYKKLVDLTKAGEGESTTPTINQVYVLLEPGIYQLIFGSKLKSAEEFQGWVFEEILPSLRKEGSYSIKPMSTAEMFLYSAQKMVELEQKQAQLEAEQTRIYQVVTLEAERTDAIEELVVQHEAELDRIFNSSGHYYTVMGYCSLIGKPIAVAAAGAIGRKASKFCKQNNIEIVPVADPRFGKVNSYPEAVLKKFI